jgi:hypothetical protein
MALELALDEGKNENNGVDRLFCLTCLIPTEIGSAKAIFRLAHLLVCRYRTKEDKFMYVCMFYVLYFQCLHITPGKTIVTVGNV